MASLDKIRILILGTTAVLLILQHQAEGNVRRKRLIAGLGLDYPNVDEVSNDIEDRTARRTSDSDSYYRTTTYPPFPGDEDEWENFQTRKPQTSRPLITPSTEIVFEGVDDDNDDDESFHRKVYPWLQRQWGHARNFFRNQIG